MFDQRKKKMVQIEEKVNGADDFFGWNPGLPDFSWSKHTKMGKNIPNYHTLYQTSIKYTNGHKIYQHFLFQGPPKFTQIGIFGLKINHLATLLEPKIVFSPIFSDNNNKKFFFTANAISAKKKKKKKF
jgi:hypothetical protein